MFDSTIEKEYTLNNVGNYSVIQGKPEMFSNGNWKAILLLSMEKFKADLICKYLGFGSGFLNINQSSRFKDDFYQNKLYNIECEKDAETVNNCTLKIFKIFEK